MNSIKSTNKVQLFPTFVIFARLSRQQICLRLVGWSPQPYPTVADIIIGRRGTKRKFSRSSESFCTTRLKKVTSTQLLILISTVVVRVVQFFFVGKKFSYPTQYVITTTKLNWNKGLPEIIIYHNCSVTMHIYLAEALQFIQIVIHIFISCSHFCRTISLDLHLAVLKYQPHTQHEVLCMIRDSLNPLYSIRYNTSLSRWWWICSWLKLSSRTNSSSSPFNQIKWIISSAGVWATIADSSLAKIRKLACQNGMASS